MTLFQDSVQAVMKNMAAGEQGYKIYTKILEQWTWLKLQQLVYKAVCSGERYRTIMVLVFVSGLFSICAFSVFITITKSNT